MSYESNQDFESYTKWKFDNNSDQPFKKFKDIEFNIKEYSPAVFDEIRRYD